MSVTRLECFGTAAYDGRQSSKCGWCKDSVACSRADSKGVPFTQQRVVVKPGTIVLDPELARPALVVDPRAIETPREDMSEIRAPRIEEYIARRHADVLAADLAECAPAAKGTATSDGSTASYYELPDDKGQLQELISYRNMNGQDAEMFRALYRKGHCSHSSKLREAKKVLFYAQAEVDRLEKYGEGA